MDLMFYAHRGTNALHGSATKAARVRAIGHLLGALENSWKEGPWRESSFPSEACAFQAAAKESC